MEIRAVKQVNAPIGVTFNVFSDITKAQERVEAITKVELLSDMTEGIGTRWRESRMMLGKEASEVVEISAYEPNKFYEMKMESRGVKYNSRVAFSESQGGTQVEMTMHGTPVTLAAKFMSLFNFLLAGAMKKSLEADVSDLKAAAEKQAVEA